MKPRVRFLNGQYVARRLGFYGYGTTIEAAVLNMWRSYRAAIRLSVNRVTYNYRGG